MSHIKTATIRPLRTEFPKVLVWVNAGEEVAITRRRQVVANLTPAGERPEQKLILPDFHARLKRIYGNKILPAMTTQATLEDGRGARRLAAPVYADTCFLGALDTNGS